MKHFFLLSFLLFLFLQSCINKSMYDLALEDAQIIIDVDSAILSPLKIATIKYIPLETSQDCIIGFASKVLIKNNKIYVADYSLTKALFVFDMNGKFLFKIAKFGQGPDEYNSLRDFDIHINGDIYILDGTNNKILIFNQTGDFIKDIKIDYSISHFCLINNKLYFSKLRESGKMFANLAVYNLAGNKTEFLLKDKKNLHDLRIIDYNPYDFFYSPDSTFYYSPKFSNIIYSITEESVRPAIGIKNLKMTPEHIINMWLQEDDGFERSKMIINNKFFIENTHIYETDKHITIEYLSGVNGSRLLYNKHSKSAYIISAYNYFETIGIDKVKGSIGNDFFGVIDFNSDNEIRQRILKSREELKNWKEDDNPVLVIFNPDM